MRNGGRSFLGGGGGGGSELSSHVTTTTHDDHTQYMHIATAREVTAIHTYQNGLISEGEAFVDGDGSRSVAFRLLNGTTKAAIGFSQAVVGNTDDLMVRVADTTSDIRFFHGNVESLVLTATEVTAMSLKATSGPVVATGTNNRFGTGANGAAGAYLRVGDQGDAGNGYLIADGTGTNIGLALRAKGTGSFKFEKPDGTAVASIDANGFARMKGGAQLGTGSIGGTGGYLNIGDFGDTGNTYIQAASSAADMSLLLQAKGAGVVRLQNAGGTDLALLATPVAPTDTPLILRINGANKLVTVGAADSGGAGHRYLRVPN